MSIQITKVGQIGKKPPKPNRWWLWMLLLSMLVVVAICFLIVIPNNFVQLGNNDVIIDPQPVSDISEVVPPIIEPEPTIIHIFESSSENGQTIRKTTTDNTPASSTLQGTINEKAKQVIRGKYGNGIARKKALGSEYKVIQRRVNEMYRKGMVRKKNNNL